MNTFRLCWLLIGLLLAGGPVAARAPSATQSKPNILVVLADQWRAAATGYAGDPNVHTPQLDRLATQSIDVTHAVSGCPVCTPFRASFLTGQRPLTHGLFLNDVPLREDAPSLAKVLKQAGYDTAYIGKWHLNGDGRSAFIPRSRRQGFDYWKVLECTHAYSNSLYYVDTPEPLHWEGYDAFAQTRDAQQYLRSHVGSAKPFLLVLAWGPPHNPYNTAPQEFRRLYDTKRLSLRPNVPPDAERAARRDLAGYYAHCSALDQCLGELWQTLRESGLEENTILLFTADHGDMLGSQGEARKQRPWDESVRVPMLWHFPATLGRTGRQSPALMNSEDLMPTLLGLCRVQIPKTVEGHDYSAHLRNGSGTLPEAALLTCVSPFGEWTRGQGGREYRGLRTLRYTYVRDRHGPWLLYDNEQDPYQQTNLCQRADCAALQAKLDKLLQEQLRRTGDEFLPGEAYIKKWGYAVDAHGTMPYSP